MKTNGQTKMSFKFRWFPAQIPDYPGSNISIDNNIPQANHVYGKIIADAST